MAAHTSLVDKLADIEFAMIKFELRRQLDLMDARSDPNQDANRKVTEQVNNDGGADNHSVAFINHSEMSEACANLIMGTILFSESKKCFNYPHLTKGIEYVCDELHKRGYNLLHPAIYDHRSRSLFAEIVENLKENTRDVIQRLRSVKFRSFIADMKAKLGFTDKEMGDHIDLLLGMDKESLKSSSEPTKTTEHTDSTSESQAVSRKQTDLPSTGGDSDTTKETVFGPAPGTKTIGTESKGLDTAEIPDPAEPDPKSARLTPASLPVSIKSAANDVKNVAESVSIPKSESGTAPANSKNTTEAAARTMRRRAAFLIPLEDSSDDEKPLRDTKFTIEDFKKTCPQSIFPLRTEKSKNTNENDKSVPQTPVNSDKKNAKTKLEASLSHGQDSDSKSSATKASPIVLKTATISDDSADTAVKSPAQMDKLARIARMQAASAQAAKPTKRKAATVANEDLSEESPLKKKKKMTKASSPVKVTESKAAKK